MVGSSLANILVQALSRPHPAEHNLNIVTGLQTREPDHALGKINDLDRLPHVEDVNRDVGPHSHHRMCRRSQHKIAGFTDSHEIADHVRVRDRDRSPRLDLRLEFRHDRSVGSQHIPNRTEIRRIRGLPSDCVISS